MDSPPETMAAAVTTAHGGPEVVEVRSRYPVPAPGPGEALVEVGAAAVNNTDLWSRAGAYGTADDPQAVAGWRGVPLDFPLIQGGDVAGTVVAVGSPEDSDWMERRVLVDPARQYRDGRPAEVVGSECDGGFAEFHLAPVRSLHDVSGSPLSIEQLGCIPIAYATAYGMVERAAPARGDRVLVTGASGGVGTAAMQILGDRGCRVVALTSSGKQDEVRSAGAGEVVLRDGISIGRLPEVDVVVDLVGGPAFGTFLESLREGGTLVTAGAIAGPVVTVDLRRIYLPQVTVAGSTMHTPEGFRAVVELARDGRIRPRVAAVYPLEEIHAAHRRFEAKDFVGKIVVVPGPVTS